MSYDCKIIEQPDQPVLSIRSRTSVEKLPQLLGESYAAIAQYLGEMGENPAGASFAGYYNMDMHDLDVEIGFPVASALQGKGNIQSNQIPGGKLATCIHVGPYSAVESAYNALMSFVAEQGHEATGVAYEFYLNDPTETPQEALRTQIVFPLR
jgi:effector-binding domain-containing protein